MFFFVDRFDKIQKVEMYKSLEKLALHVLEKIGITLELGRDPVKLAQENLGNRGKVLTVSKAFKMIANTEGQAAQELAAEFHQAIERTKS
jgi:hypothetical protein